MFGLVERFINAKVLELSEDHWLGDQVALEALVRFSDEELKHQALFRLVDAMVGEVLPGGYRFDVDPNAVARAGSRQKYLGGTGADAGYRAVHPAPLSPEHRPRHQLSELFKDVFLFHWKEESQHAILDELEWVRHDAGVTAEQRDSAVDEFIELVAAVDGILQAQAKADASYFATTCGRAVDAAEARAIEAAFLKAYRWQYIHSGAQHPHFGKVLSEPDHRKAGPAHPAGARDAAMIQCEISTQSPKQRRPIMGAQTKTAEPNVVNGINVDDLFALIDDVKRDPAKGKTNWRVATTWQGQARSRAEIESYGIGGEKVPRRFSIDIDEPRELGGSNSFANPQEHLIAALNACMTVGYVAQCAVRGITLESLAIETDGEIDLRGFLGIDPAVPPGYENLSYTVRIKGNGTKEQFAEIHEAVMATSPNFYNLSRPVALKPALVVE